MGTSQGTSQEQREPTAPFSPELRLGLPPQGAFIRAVIALGEGEETAFPLDFMSPDLMARYVANHSNRRSKLELRTESDRYVVTKTMETDVARGKGVAARLVEMAIGDTITIDGPRVATVRSVASLLLKRDQPLRFTVTETGHDLCRVTRINLDDSDRRAWGRYQFSHIGPGCEFTTPPGDHSGIEAMRSACAYHGKARGLVFKARENIDGSITVRCYPEGGLPPKWAMDQEHARMQAAIQAAKPGQEANKNAA